MFCSKGTTERVSGRKMTLPAIQTLGRGSGSPAPDSIDPLT